MTDTGSARARLWTTAIKLNSEYFEFSKQLYDSTAEHFGVATDLGRQTFFEQYLGEHYANIDNVQTLCIDAKRYLDTISKLLKIIDDKVMVYGIVHDKDVKTINNTITPIEEHLHVLIKFTKAVRLTAVSNAIGVKTNLIEKGKVKGRLAFSSAMAYLIHAMSDNKHQYSPSEVYSFGDSYEDFYNKEKDNWDKKKAEKRAERQQENFETVRQAVMLGKYTKEDLIGAEDEDLYMLYVRNKQALDDARTAYLERQFIKYNRAIDNGTLKLQSLFVTGQAGLGKTRLAKSIAEGVCDLTRDKPQKWRVFQAAPSNPFDDYDGEEIILLDDVRATSLKSASDWLKLMDPHNNGKTSARYHNASPMPRLIIITATETPHEFFSYVKSASNNEPLDQFLRRIQWTARVVGIDEVHLGSALELPNPVTKTLIDEKIVSRHNSERSGESKTYKPGREKTFKYVYGDRITGDIDEVAHAMIDYYCEYYELGKSKTTIPNEVPTSMLPIRHDETIINLDKFSRTAINNSEDNDN